MFFVGATGQILTLMLTVCLPFVFFFSGHQNIEISDSALQIEVRQIQHEVIHHEISAVSYSEITAEETQHCDLILKDYTYRKIPLREFNVKKESFYIGSSGNKAPPVFHCFC